MDTNLFVFFSSLAYTYAQIGIVPYVSLVLLRVVQTSDSSAESALHLVLDPDVQMAVNDNSNASPTPSDQNCLTKS
jgi:hypothetical protein